MKKYQTEEERLQARRDARKRWRDKNKEYQREYYEANKPNILNYHKDYSKTPMGRALGQVAQYRRMDRRNGFGNVIDFDAKWIVENIYTKPCTHCGKEGWKVIGCNRIDNDKPHTKDNVEPCCQKCNTDLAAIYNSIHQVKGLVDQIDVITGEVIYTWRCTYDAIKGGFMHADAVARGERKQDKGYIFKRYISSEYQ